MNDASIHLSTDSTQEEIEKWLGQTREKKVRIKTLMNLHSKSIKQLKQEEVELEIEIQETKKILNLIYGVNVDAPFYK